ncbi:hypothetical protein [Microbacterium maritypicum]|uniref:Uncharacterized protein n=1 Tax=Microbacterium maritypicum MF109 TaxID=1333857 RepID=T5KFS6_MICMQ|nr:hypothetical protein [Microbacterium liquefaciens]EQM73040.1 hypothetical protein L687_07120 [Microbacterium maritypicum MF109]
MNLGMVAATWKSVEAVGIPDSPVRRMLFDLADRFQNHGPNDDIALLSGAFTALMDVLQEHHADKTPLQVQAEARRTTRDLRARGINIPDIVFRHTDFELPPQTPNELAVQLGYVDGGRAVRRVLRSGFPEHEKHARWEPLTDAQVHYVRAHLPARP